MGASHDIQDKGYVNMLISVAYLLQTLDQSAGGSVRAGTKEDPFFMARP